MNSAATEVASPRPSWYVMTVDATRRRLEALLAQLEEVTATADHTIAEVKAALRDIDDARSASAGRYARTAAGSRKHLPVGRATRKR